MNWVGPRRWVTIALCTLMASATGLATGPATASVTPHRATTPGATYLDSEQLKFTSTTGRTLFANVLVDRARYGSANQTSLLIEVGDRAGEYHEWSLNVPNQAFVFDTATGRGSVITKPAQIEPFGALSLTIKPRGEPVVHVCSADNSWTRQTVSITGTFLFKTQSTKWGNIGSRHHQSAFKGKSRVETDYGDLGADCFNPSPPCTGTVLWNSVGGTYGAFSGGSSVRRGKRRGDIQFFGNTTINKPSGANRFDVVDLTTKVPKLTTRSTARKSCGSTPARRA
jgi:hypothetical protein